MQIENSELSRFTALISYEGSSLDPLEIFIKSRMTDVLGAVKNHSGKILASFREIPVVSIARAKLLHGELKEKGISGILIIGNPNQPLTTTDSVREGVHDVYSVYNSTTESYLISQPYKIVRDLLTEDSDVSQPNYYAYAGETSASTTTYYIYPTSDGSYTLKVSYNRKPNLSNTLSDSTFVKLPDLPIVLKAYALAISERGEDGGALYNETDAAAQSALSDAIANFDSNAGYRNSLWYVV